MANNKWTKHLVTKSTDEFKQFILEHNSKFFNLNLENFQTLISISEKLSTMLINVYPLGINQIRAAFSSLTKEFNVKARNDLHESYYLFRGYSLEYAKHTISELQKKRSKRCKEFWINKGYSEKEAELKVAEKQSSNGKKLGEKLRNDKQFRDKFSVWSINHWIDKGFSEDDAKLKVNSFNPSCKEFYNSTEAYNLGRKNISNRVKKLWENGVYDDKVKMIQTRYTSKQEKIFFEFLQTEIPEINHVTFGINVREHSDDYYYVYDGYYKSSDGIILIEYDGTYWHNNQKDENRDRIVLETRKDILGILRTNDYYFYKHKLNLNEIKDAITKIKSKKSNRILLYESA